jgi:hypothetical protein
MEDHIVLTGVFSVLLLLFAFKKWALKGDVFHPGFIYCVINCGFFIVFAFGPYSYDFKLDLAYYYVYVIISFAFVAGIIRGGVQGSKKIVKEIKLSYLQLWIIYGILLTLLLSVLISLIRGGVIDLESGVDNRTEQIEQVQSKLNIIAFISAIIQTSFIRLSSAIITAYSVAQRQHYLRVALLVILLTLNGIITNSRTSFLIGLLPILISIYSVLKDQGVIDFSKIRWSKNFKFTLPITIIILFVIGTLTNARSSIVAADYTVPYEYIESTTSLHRKEWFNEFAKSQPVAIVNPIAELSIYAGSTVAHGGLVSNVAMRSGLRTWGLRNFFSIHRILSQLKLDGGLSDFSRKNYQSIVANAASSLYGIEYSWWGYPANLIVDFGYIGSPLASFITGWMLGWIYGRVSNSGSILKATGYSMVLIAVLLSPAFGPFGDLSNFTTFLIIIIYILNNSINPKYLQY